MLNGEAIQRLQELYSKGAPSADSRLSNRLVYNKLITLRAKFLSQQAGKKQFISVFNYQTLDCIEMIPFEDSSLARNCGTDILLRSTLPIPDILTNYDKELIQSITATDGELNLDVTTWKDRKYKAGNKYTSKKPDAFIKPSDKHLYATNLNNGVFNTLMLVALFEQPLTVDLFPSFCNTNNGGVDPCKSYLDYEFPIDADVFDVIVEEAAVELIDKFSKRKQDILNNGKDDINEG